MNKNMFYDLGKEPKILRCWASANEMKKSLSNCQDALIDFMNNVDDDLDTTLVQRVAQSLNELNIFILD